MLLNFFDRVLQQHKCQLHSCDGPCEPFISQLIFATFGDRMFTGLPPLMQCLPFVRRRKLASASSLHIRSGENGGGMILLARCAGAVVALGLFAAGTAVFHMGSQTIRYVLLVVCLTIGAVAGERVLRLLKG